MDGRFVPYMVRRRERIRVPEEEWERAATARPADRLSRNQVFHYSNSQHSSSLLENLAQQHRDGLFVDCVVKVGQEKFSVHRSVMAAFSAYFDALWRFNARVDSSPKREQMAEVCLDDMSVDAVRALIDYAYSGNIDITHQNVREILKCADFLCVKSVCEACCKYLIDTLDYDGAIDCLRFALSINNEELENGTVLYIAQHFCDFYKQGRLLNLEEEILALILSCDKLVVMEELPLGQNKQFYFVPSDRQEEIVFRCVLDYTNHTQNYDSLYRLLSSVRLQLISSNVLDALTRLEPIVETPACSQLLRSVLQYKAENGETSFTEDLGSHLPRDLSDVVERRWTKKIATQVFEVVEDFDDSDLVPDGCYIIGMKIYSRRWDDKQVIGGLEVRYSNGKTVLHGNSDYGYEVDEFMLGSDERIVGVAVQSGWMVDCLVFETNKGNRFPREGAYGGDGGGPSDFRAPAPSAYLTVIKGKVMQTQGYTAVRHLQFGWVHSKNIG